MNSWNKATPTTFVLNSGKWYWEIKNLDSTYPNYINPAFMNANYYSNLANILMWMNEFEKAIKAINRAIEIDPNYAAAHAGLADCYIVEPAYYMALPNEAYPNARVAALRALEIDNKLAMKICKDLQIPFMR